jgi:maleamate amidohydrolase
MSRIWEHYLSERDRNVMARAGYRNPMGFGERPALLVIDVNMNFTGDRREPVEEAIRRWPNSCGEAGWDALPKISALIDCAHEVGLPVFFFTDGFREDGWNMGSWQWKVSRTQDEKESARKLDICGSDLHPDLDVAPSDVIIRKLKPSGFHGTPLNSLLNLLKADSVIVCGTSTSGCVRATVIDAFSENYRVVVSEDACFDRVELSHAVNLFDMDSKYADVLPTNTIVDHLRSVSPFKFALPKGAR